MSTVGPAYRYAAVVTRVVDGDTLELTVDVGFRMTMRGPFRLAHLDCPEMNTPEGRAARDFTVAWCAEHPDLLVETQRNPEKYGRWLAVVMDVEDHEVLNDALLDSGHARPYEGGGR